MHRLVGGFSAFVVAMTTVLVCIPLYVLGILRLVIPITRFRRWLAYPMDVVIDVWVSSFRWLISTCRLIDIRVEIPPQLRDRNNWQVIVCNHQSWVDIVVLQVSFRDFAPVLKFFTKRELIWVPFVGLAMWFLGFPYVYRARSSGSSLSTTQRETNETVLKREGRRFLEKPVSVINFVEGTRFTLAKRDARGSPYGNLLQPRRGGLLQTLVVLEDRVETVLNATIRYRGRVPGFWELLSGQADGVELVVKEIPKPSTDQDALTSWLNDLWSEKDRQLASDP
ncbi:MAG: acetyltransferase [Gammaproteobacteria bacterium]|nr:acetyltransferase [Gammaproteobacteria bacterium]